MTKAFEYNIIQKLGVPAIDNDFDKDYLTPIYEYYDDDHQEGNPDAPPEQLTPTPEIGGKLLKHGINVASRWHPCEGTSDRAQT